MGRGCVRGQGELVSESAWLLAVDEMYTVGKSPTVLRDDDGRLRAQYTCFYGARGQNNDRGSVFLPQRFFIGLGHSCGGKIAMGGVYFCLRGFS